MVRSNLSFVFATAVAVAILATPALAQQACDVCNPASGNCGDCATTCAGFIGGADMVILKPYASDPQRLSIVDEGDTDSLSLDDNAFDICPRLWFGYVGATGLGARARYFRFDHGLDAETGTAVSGSDSAFFPANTEFTARGRLNIYAVDIDVFQQVRFGRFIGDLGGGIRAGGVGRKFNFTVDEPAEPMREGELSKNFDGLGPTLFAELQRPIGVSGFALVANARGSVLFGNERLNAVANEDIDMFSLSGSAYEKHDDVVGVAELQLGCEYSRPLSRGGKAFVNILWEGQLWSGSGAILDVISNDVGLVGCSIGAGIMR